MDYGNKDVEFESLNLYMKFTSNKYMEFSCQDTK